MPVGGTPAKIEAARQAGLKRVLIPKDNWQDTFSHIQGVEVVPVEELTEALVNMPLNTWGLNALENRVMAHGTAICQTNDR